MALNNFYTIVNNSGSILKTAINSKIIVVGIDQYANGNLFTTGEEINIEINGQSISLFLPEGKNSWSTLVYDSKGIISIFPSSPCQRILSY